MRRQVCSCFGCVAVNLSFLNLACVWLQACSFVVYVAVSLLFCFTPGGRQASSFILRLCGGGKEKKKRRRSCFVACVAVSLKFVVLYYACGAASL